MSGIKGRFRWRTVAAVAAAFAALGCTGDDDDGPAGNTGSIQVATNPTTLSVEQGGTGTVTVTLTRGGGFNAAVSLAVAGLPVGVVPTVTPAQLSGTTTQAQVAVAVASTVTPGTYTATITATATGVGTATTTYQLTVTNAPTYTLTMATAALSIPAGANGQATVNIDRTNFATGAVALALLNPPAGISGTFVPNPSTTNASALTVNVAASVAPGTYSLTIQGTATPGVRTAALALTVTPTPAFTIVANPAAVSTAPGGTANSVIDITRTNFTGGVTLALDAPPAGITATFTPSPTTTNTSAMAMSVAASVAPGAYPVTVKGTASGLADQTTTVTVNVQAPAAAYTLNLSPNTLSVAQGASGQVNITLTRTNFTGTVNLLYEGGTSGITGTLTPAATTGNSATFNVAVPIGVAPGSYQLTIRGTATGLTDRVASLQLTVTAVQGSIALAAAPPTLTVMPGQSGIVSLTLTRTNFTGAVTFAAGVPAGVTPTFNPASTTSNLATVTLAVAANVAPGTFPVTITASGQGVTNAVAQVSLAVPPPISGGNTEFGFCSLTETPHFFAVQDGAGAWQAVTGSGVGGTTTFTFNITQNRAGVFYVQQRSAGALAADALAVNPTGNRATLAKAVTERTRASRSAQQAIGASRTRTFARRTFVDFYETTVLFASATELAQIGTDNCAATQAGKTVTGTVAGIGDGEVGLLSLGSSFTGFLGGLSTNPVTFTDVPSGTLDFIGSRANDQGVMDRAVVFRNLNIPDGGALPQPIDFAGPTSSAAASANVTVTNAQGEELSVVTLLTTAHNIFTILSLGGDAGVATTVPWYGLAPAASIATDIHGLIVSAVPVGSQDLDDRTVWKYVGAVANQTLALGPSITAPTTTQLAAGSYPRFRFQGTLPAEYRQFIDLLLTPQDGTGNYMNISATAAYLVAAGSASSYDLSMPDVAGLAGFAATSRLTAGGNGLETTAIGWTGTGIFQLRPQVGQEMRMSTKSSVVTVP